MQRFKIDEIFQKQILIKKFQVASNLFEFNGHFIVIFSLFAIKATQSQWIKYVECMTYKCIDQMKKKQEKKMAKKSVCANNNLCEIIPWLRIVQESKSHIANK